MIAAGMVGPDGHVIGVEMTPAMIEKARVGAREAGLEQVEFREGHAEAVRLTAAHCGHHASTPAPGRGEAKHRSLDELNRGSSAGNGAPSHGRGRGIREVRDDLAKRHLRGSSPSVEGRQSVRDSGCELQGIQAGGLSSEHPGAAARPALRRPSSRANPVLQRIQPHNETADPRAGVGRSYFRTSQRSARLDRLSCLGPRSLPGGAEHRRFP
jgi:hypothetical protein